MFGRSTRGIYIASSAVLSLQAAAHTSLQGFIWLVNPVGSTIKMAVRRVEFKHSCLAAAAANTRVTLERVTFTGTWANPITAVQRNSGESAPAGSLQSSSTGATLATVGANAVHYTTWAPVVITAAGVLIAVEDEWLPMNEDSYITLLAGEGLVVRQPDVGVTSDPRKLIVTAEWEEYN